MTQSHANKNTSRFTDKISPSTHTCPLHSTRCTFESIIMRNRIPYQQYARQIITQRFIASTNPFKLFFHFLLSFFFPSKYAEYLYRHLILERSYFSMSINKRYHAPFLYFKRKTTFAYINLKRRSAFARVINTEYVPPLTIRLQGC